VVFNEKATPSTMSDAESTDQPLQEEVKQQLPNKVERIHIGGLDPARLKGSEVAKRLESLEGLSISSVDALNDDKTFFYVNASSRTQGKSALDLIIKQYHNVRWKGCKIIVQSARPHFLERLVEERADRFKRQEELEQAIANYYSRQQENNDAPLEASKKLPRHMRIRQMYGTAAYHVDTKPCQVEEWIDFKKALLKMRSRRMKNTDEELNMHKVFMNRAVHLRFPREATPEHTDEDDNDSESEGVSESDQEITMNEKSSTAYVWSDSEDEASVAKAKPYAHEIDTSVFALALKEHEEGAPYVPVHTELAEQTNVKTPAHEADTSIFRLAMLENKPSEAFEQAAKRQRNDGSPEDGDAGSESDVEDSDSDNGFEDRSYKRERKQERKEKEPEEGRFQWSSDEDDEPDSVDVRPVPRQRKEVNANEEFSAAIDFGADENSDEDDYDGAAAPFLAPSTPTVDLNDDVKANLSVMSLLFPDMDAAPKKIEESTGAVASKASSAFGSLGMHRYDPSKESSQIFEVKPEKPPEIDEISKVEATDEDTFDEDAASGDHSSEDDSSASETDDDADKPNPAKSEETPLADADIYEEKKLEDIFRTAREGGIVGFQMSSPIGLKGLQENRHESSGCAFSFGFDLGTPKEEPTNDSTSPYSNEFNTVQSNVAVAAETTEEDLPKEPNHSRLLRRGFNFPQTTLKGYVNDFFELNEGSYMADNPEGFRHDEEIKHRWKEERHTLTLDWKRKKKYAQAKIQKKMKFR
jgi:hypothetical protein